MMMNNHIGATGSASATLGNLKTSKLTGSVSVAQPTFARPGCASCCSRSRWRCTRAGTPWCWLSCWLRPQLF